MKIILVTKFMSQINCSKFPMVFKLITDKKPHKTLKPKTDKEKYTQVLTHIQAHLFTHTLVRKRIY